MRPRIAIPEPTSRDLEYNARSWPQYARAVELSGGVPVRMPLAPFSHLAALVSNCQGFLLPGSPADVRPERYGQQADPLSARADLAREDCDDLLLESADRSLRPLLGICFGLQSMNVWYGGSLIQHLSPLPVSHSAGPSVAVAHTVLVTKESLVATLVDTAEAQDQAGFVRLPVNTSHHQAVAVPGATLRVAARSPDDGVIEALELERDEGAPGSRFLLGLQWHPERSFEISSTSRNLFRRLVDEATAWSSNQPGWKSV